MKFFTARLFALILLMSTAYHSAAEVHVINQSGFEFSPASFSCNVGDVIRWEWSAGSHTTTSVLVPEDADTWNSVLTQAVQSFEYTIEVAGTYAYVCTLHAQSGMAGTFQASAPTSIKPVLSSNRDMVVGLEMGSKILHINLEGGEAINGAIKIYDFNGRVIATVVEGNFGTTDLHYQYDCSPLGRGIYFVRFESGSKVITRKVMLS